MSDKTCNVGNVMRCRQDQFNVVRVLRVLRVLRPLRAINRAKGLKVISVKNLLNKLRKKCARVDGPIVVVSIVVIIV